MAGLCAPATAWAEGSAQFGPNQDLIELEDPWPYNAGPKRGALVEARVGAGRWVYVGLGFFRQLPAGVPGAYRLFANLLSLKEV